VRVGGEVGRVDTPVVSCLKRRWGRGVGYLNFMSYRFMYVHDERTRRKVFFLVDDGLLLRCGV